MGSSLARWSLCHACEETWGKYCSGITGTSGFLFAEAMGRLYNCRDALNQNIHQKPLLFFFPSKKSHCLAEAGLLQFSWLRESTINFPLLKHISWWNFFGEKGFSQWKSELDLGWRCWEMVLEMVIAGVWLCWVRLWLLEQSAFFNVSSITLWIYSDFTTGKNHPPLVFKELLKHHESQL